jgi:DNA-binding response OmpR family regulator
MSTDATPSVVRVLVVDDDPIQCEMVQRSLSREGFAVSTISSPMGVSNLIRTTAPDIVLLDLDLPAIPGDRLLELARKQAPKHTLFVFYSASDTTKLRQVSMINGADGWISKSTVGRELADELRAFWAAGRA